MVVDVFAALNNKDFSPLYKSGVAVKLVSQYFYKRWYIHQKTPASMDDAADTSAMKKLISKALQEKFLVQNQEKVI